MEKFEESTMKEFVTLLCKGERVYFDEVNNIFGCGCWLCRGVNQIPFSTVGRVNHLNATSFIKDLEYNSAIYKYTDEVGCVYEYNDIVVTINPKYAKLFKGCDYSVSKGCVTCWHNGHFVGLILGIKR